MVIALIVASGNGTRMGQTSCPKQFLLVNEKPLLIHTIEPFQNYPKVDKIFIVTNKEYVEKVQSWCKDFKLNKVSQIVEGGETRQISVWNGLNALKNAKINDGDIILIHDGARPNVDEKIINANIEGVEKYGAVDTVIPASDTIIRSVEGKELTEIQNRKEQFMSQTPQSFKFYVIYNAHLKAQINKDFDTTDDCKLVLKYEQKIHLVEGSKLNFKITTMDDLKIFEALNKN